MRRGRVGDASVAVRSGARETRRPLAAIERGGYSQEAGEHRRLRGQSSRRGFGCAHVAAGWGRATVRAFRAPRETTVNAALLPRTVRTTVLFVDDDPDVRSVHQTAAKCAGIHAEVARDGHEALALANVFHPNVIVLASDLPILSGPEVVSRLRASPATRAIPILFLSEDAAGRTRDRYVACDVH